MNNEDNSFNNQGIMNEEPEQMEEQNFPRANGGGFAQNIKNTAADLMRGVHAGLGKNPMRGQEKPDDKKKKDGLDKKDKDKKDSKDGNKDKKKDKKKDNEHKNPLPGAGGKKSKDPRDANDKKPGEKKENNSKEKGSLASRLNPFNRKRGAQQGALGKEKTGGIKEKIGKSFKTGIKKIWTILPIQAKIAIIIIVPMIILLLFLFNILFAALAGASFSALCGTSGSSTYNGEEYTGSTDGSEFLCKMQNPLGKNFNYTITSGPGTRWGMFHQGIDLAIARGTPIYAVQAGVVTEVNDGCKDDETVASNTNCGGEHRGNFVAIKHGGIVETHYYHMVKNSIKVKKGDKVGKGQLIGNVASSGRSTGNHLHFGMKLNDLLVYDYVDYFTDYQTFKTNCGSKWDGEPSGDSASATNDTTDYVSTSSNSSSSANCCVSSTGSSSSSEDYCPNGVTLVPGPEGDTSGYYKDPDKFPIGTFSLDDYIQMVVGAENPSVGAEAIKAQMVAAKTFTIKRTNNCSSSIRNSEYDQTAKKMELVSDEIKKAYSEGGNSVITLNGDTISSEYSSFLGTCSSGSCTGSSIKVPSSEKVTYTMPEKYLTTKQDAGHGRGMSQNYAAYLADQGKTYKEILEYFYADGIEINGGGNTCSIGGDGFNGNIRVYYQSDYPNVAYCSGKGEHNVAVSGCGPTAMAIVVSSLLGEEHNPEEMAKYSCKNDFYVPGTGTKHAFFASAGKKYGLSVKQLDVSEANNKEVLIALNSGKKLVIAATNKKPFTSGGHFIVLTSHKDGQVFVQDPNKSNDSKLFDFEEVVVPATTRYWIISKE